MALSSNSYPGIPGVKIPVANLSAAAINALSAPIAVLDSQAEIVGVNRAWRDSARTGNGDPAGYIGENYVAVCERAAIADPQVREVIEGMQAVLAGHRQLFVSEYRCDEPDGTPRWFKMSITPMPEQHGGAVVAHEDITERKAAIEARQREHELLRTVLETSASAIIVYDAHGITRMVSRSAVEMMNLHERVLVGTHFADPIWTVAAPDGQMIPIEQRPVSRVLNERRTLSTQRLSFMPDGLARRQLSVNLSPVLNARGEVELVIVTVHDITQELEAQEALKRRLEIEALVSEISRLFNRSASRELEGAVQEAIGLLGRFLKVDRVGIFFHDEALGILTQTNEWCRDGVPPRAQAMQHRPTSAFAWGMGKLRQDRVLRVDDVESLPIEATVEKHHWREIRVRAMVAVPVLIDDRLLGALSLDVVDKPRHWQDEELAILGSLATVLGHALERKRIEEQAWADRNLNAAILDSAGALMCVLDTQMNIVRFNRACERVTGYRFAEVKGRRFDELLLPEDERQRVVHVVSEAAGGRFPSTHESDWLSMSGQRRRIQWYNNAIFGEQGKVAYVVSIGVEVTGQRRAEAALRHRVDVENLLTGINTRFNRLPPSELPTGIEQALAELARFVDADHACVLLHMPRRQALTMQYEWCKSGLRPVQAHCQHLPIPESDEFRSKLAAKQPWVDHELASLGRRDHPLATMFRRIDTQSAVLSPMVVGNRVLGCVCVAFGSASQAQACDHLMLNAVAMSVAYAIERAEVDTALRASEQRQRVLLSGIPDPIYRLSREGEVLDVEAMPHDGMLMDPEAMIGHNITHVLRDEAGAMIKAAIPEALSSDEHVALTYRIESEQGPLQFETRLLATGPDEVTAIERDITSQRRAEDEARMRRQELMQVSRLATVGEMAAGLAHEMNQPLAAIVNYARGSLRILEQNGNEPGRLQTPLQQIAQQAERAGRIIRNIRRFVARHELRRMLMDINQVVTQALEFVESDVGSSGMSLNANLMPGLPPVMIDSVLIEQVVVNLVLNAIDAMQESASQARPQIEVNTRRDVDQIYITVADTGPGVKDADLPHVFDPFFTTKSNGLGLGLAISKSIVEGHQGRIWAESLNGKGASFIFAIPLPEIDPTSLASNERSGSVEST